MNKQITYFVEEIQSHLMMDLAVAESQNLYDIASTLIAQHDDAAMTHICQAYEVVKHQLVG